MSTTAKVPAAFDLRSSSVTMLLIVLRTASVEALRAELQARYGDAPGTFEDDLTLVDLSHLDAAAQIDVAALVAALHDVRLLPVAVRGGSALQMAAALAAGLGDAGEGGEQVSAPSSRAEPAAPAAVHGDDAPMPLGTASADTAAPLPSATSSIAELSPAAATAPAPTEPAAGSATTLVIDKPLRSGQQVYARGGDLVVLAAVNYGAEVIADGNVHVYGPLRGKAIAGARGDTAARIFSTSLQPELLSIAGTYRTSENPLPADVAGRAAQVRLDGERLVFEPLG